MKFGFGKLCTVLLLIYILAACGPKAPANEFEAVRSTGILKVGTSADYPPYEMLDESGELSGFDIDMVEEIGKRMGLKVEFVDMPFESLIPAVRDAEIDIAVAAFRYTNARDEVVDFTDPYFYVVDHPSDGNAQQLESQEPNTIPTHIIVPEGAKELRNALNNVILAMLEDGFIHELSEKHMPGEIIETQP